MADQNHKAILLTLVDLLKEQAQEYAGTVEGQIVWQALNAIKDEAAILEVPLEDVGLDGYDIDAVLTAPKAPVKA